MVDAPKVYSKRLGTSERIDPPYIGDEREILVSYLDFHRATFEAKCTGVPSQRLSEQTVRPSSLSLHGLVRHLAGVERWWFRIQFAGEDVPLLYYSDDDPDQDFDRLDGDVTEAFAVWRAECQQSRDVVAAASSLEQTGTMLNGQVVNLRRVLVNMIAEYARHNGHADLLRERIDGATGL
jgi:hypothetical protein